MVINKGPSDSSSVQIIEDFKKDQMTGSNKVENTTLASSISANTLIPKDLRNGLKHEGQAYSPVEVSLRNLPVSPPQPLPKEGKKKKSKA